MEIFVLDYDWNSQWNSVEESASDYNYSEGDEFKMVRLNVGACTTYRIVNGKPVPVAVAFPEGQPSND